jgi:hypothetical protein
LHVTARHGARRVSCYGYLGRRSTGPWTGEQAPFCLLHLRRVTSLRREPSLMGSRQFYSIPRPRILVHATICLPAAAYCLCTRLLQDLQSLPTSALRRSRLPFAGPYFLPMRVALMPQIAGWSVDKHPSCALLHQPSAASLKHNWLDPALSSEPQHCVSECTRYVTSCAETARTSRAPRTS